MGDGRIAETGTVGREGFTGCDTLLGNDSTSTSRLIVQVPGWASRTQRAALRELMETSPHAAELLGAYTKAFIGQLLQSVACNASHSVEERCARWLLMTHDRADSDSFQLTQELLAVMLGVRRASVGRVSSAFQQSGLIRYRRGVITVANRSGLESVSCECYSIVRRVYQQLLPRPGTKQRAYAR
jgi:CRP-like cAMP-binding protein